MRVLPAPASMSPAHAQWVLLAVTPAALAPSHSACLMYAATTSVHTAITHACHTTANNWLHIATVRSALSQVPVDSGEVAAYFWF